MPAFRPRPASANMTPRLIPLALTALLAPSLASAAGFKLYTTVPGQTVGTATSTAASSATGAADSTELTAPAPPAEGVADVEWAIPPNTADVLANSATTGLGVSRNQQGNFWGLSIELSVVNRIRTFLFEPLPWLDAAPKSDEGLLATSQTDLFPLCCAVDLPNSRN